MVHVVEAENARMQAGVSGASADPCPATARHDDCSMAPVELVDTFRHGSKTDHRQS